MEFTRRRKASSRNVLPALVGRRLTRSNTALRVSSLYKLDGDYIIIVCSFTQSVIPVLVRTEEPLARPLFSRRKQRPIGQYDTFCSALRSVSLTRSYLTGFVSSSSIPALSHCRRISASPLPVPLLVRRQFSLSFLFRFSFLSIFSTLSLFPLRFCLSPSAALYNCLFSLLCPLLSPLTRSAHDRAGEAEPPKRPRKAEAVEGSGHVDVGEDRHRGVLHRHFCPSSFSA